MTTTSKRRRKNAARGRKRKKVAARLEELRAEKLPERKRKLLGIGSRGVSITLSFNDEEVPVDPANPVGSAEHNADLARDWAKKGHPIAGDG